MTAPVETRGADLRAQGSHLQAGARAERLAGVWSKEDHRMHDELKRPNRADF